MEHPTTLRTCVIAGALVFSSAAGVLAQGGFQINGRLKLEGGSLDDARVLVYKNGEKQRTITSGLSKFSLDLDLNAAYILEFEKDGFVSKKLSFDTHAPAEAITNGFTPFEFAVSMFKQYDGVNTVVFNQPVGMIRYDKETDDFDYDTDYTKSIQSALEKTMQEVAAKQEQEKGKDAEEAKRAEQEAKAKAKQEAEAAKAKAKADAERSKQEAEAAKQREKAEREAAAAADRERQLKDTEAKKAETAAKKAEQERLAAETKKKEEPEPKPKPAPKADPPPPVAKAKPAKAQKPPAPPPVVARSTGSRKDPRSGDDTRRGISPNEAVEESPIRPAVPNEVVEAKPELKVETPEVLRNEELIVEPNQVIMRIELDNGKERTEYRKVVHKYGPVFYFKDGQSISKLLFETEALADNK